MTCTPSPNPPPCATFTGTIQHLSAEAQGVCAGQNHGIAGAQAVNSHLSPHRPLLWELETWGWLWEGMPVLYCLLCEGGCAGSSVEEGRWKQNRTRCVLWSHCYC